MVHIDISAYAQHSANKTEMLFLHQMSTRREDIQPGDESHFTNTILLCNLNGETYALIGRGTTDK
jgi:hypothetical protein